MLLLGEGGLRSLHSKYMFILRLPNRRHFAELRLGITLAGMLRDDFSEPHFLHRHELLDDWTIHDGSSILSELKRLERIVDLLASWGQTCNDGRERVPAEDVRQKCVELCVEVGDCLALVVQSVDEGGKLRCRAIDVLATFDIVLLDAERSRSGEIDES